MLGDGFESDYSSFLARFFALHRGPAWIVSQATLESARMIVSTADAALFKDTHPADFRCSSEFDCLSALSLW